MAGGLQSGLYSDSSTALAIRFVEMSLAVVNSSLTLDIYVKYVPISTLLVQRRPPGVNRLPRPALGSTEYISISNYVYFREMQADAENKSALHSCASNLTYDHCEKIRLSAIGRHETSDFMILNYHNKSVVQYPHDS